MTRFARCLAALIAALIACIYITAWADGVAEYDLANPQLLTPAHLYAQSALLVDERTGEVLFSKDSRVRMFPASTTKIMTLLLALESDVALDEQVTIPAEAGNVPEGSSVIPVKPGDVMSFSDLLYGFMLSSGNDGANAIAVLVDGGIDPFVDRMNARAAELGCEGTHFVNVHGYHDAMHYTTAQDLAILSCEAMKNPEFRRIVAAPKWLMHITRGGAIVEQEIISRNSLLQSDEKYYYPACTGIKTGHTHKAGWCFVGSAERDGKRVICVVLNCENEFDKWYDAAKLFEYGFTRYAPVTLENLLQQARERYAVAQIDGADPADPEGGRLLMTLEEIEGGEQTVQVVSESQISLDAALERVVDGATVQWDRPLTAPVSRGERMGRVSVELDDGTRAEAALVASRDVAVEPTPVPTQTPTPDATAAAQQEQPPSDNGFGAVPVIAGLAALLAIASAALAARLRSGRRRRRSRRRAGRRR